MTHVFVCVEPVTSDQLAPTPGVNVLVCVCNRQPVWSAGQFKVNVPASNIAVRFAGFSSVRTALLVTLPLPPATCTEYVPASLALTGLREIVLAICPLSTVPFFFQM